MYVMEQKIKIVLIRDCFSEYYCGTFETKATADIGLKSITHQNDTQTINTLLIVRNVFKYFSMSY